MIKHIILWKLDDKYSSKELNEIKANAKRELEALVSKISGLSVMKIEINGIGSSNADMMLYSEFINKEALNEYKTHPEHVRVADGFVRPYTVQRLCLDFEV